MNELTTKKDVTRALNQLTSVIVGGKHARETDNLKSEPNERIDKCYQLVLEEQKDAFSNPAKINQILRKMDSLRSLLVLAKLANEIDDWG
tara:strand:- start:839 stop:1108 length:270 start_codon:yes stop_codon:yes gene_type:complete